MLICGFVFGEAMTYYKKFLPKIVVFSICFVLAIFLKQFFTTGNFCEIHRSVSEKLACLAESNKIIWEDKIIKIPCEIDSKMKVFPSNEKLKAIIESKTK